MCPEINFSKMHLCLCRQKSLSRPVCYRNYLIKKVNKGLTYFYEKDII